MKKKKQTSFSFFFVSISLGQTEIIYKMKYLRESVFLYLKVGGLLWSVYWTESCLWELLMKFD